MFEAIWTAQLETLKSKFGSEIEEIRIPGSYPTDVPIVFVKKDSVINLLAFLKSEPGLEYAFLADITATDEEADPRFEVVYQLFSHSKKCRIRVKTRVKEGDTLLTAVGLWPAADWLEREVWDMFGVRFKGHPDLRRILLDERWEGHPLRKDYPIRGYQVFSEPEPIHESLLK